MELGLAIELVDHEWFRTVGVRVIGVASHVACLYDVGIGSGSSFASPYMSDASSCSCSAFSRKDCVQLFATWPSGPNELLIRENGEDGYSLSMLIPMGFFQLPSVLLCDVLLAGHCH